MIESVASRAAAASGCTVYVFFFIGTSVPSHVSMAEVSGGTVTCPSTLTPACTFSLECAEGGKVEIILDAGGTNPTVSVNSSTPPKTVGAPTSCTGLLTVATVGSNYAISPADGAGVTLIGAVADTGSGTCINGTCAATGSITIGCTPPACSPGRNRRGRLSPGRCGRSEMGPQEPGVRWFADPEPASLLSRARR